MLPKNYKDFWSDNLVITIKEIVERNGSHLFCMIHTKKTKELTCYKLAAVKEKNEN